MICFSSTCVCVCVCVHVFVYVYLCLCVYLSALCMGQSDSLFLYMPQYLFSVTQYFCLAHLAQSCLEMEWKIILRCCSVFLSFAVACAFCTGSLVFVMYIFVIGPLPESLLLCFSFPVSVSLCCCLSLSICVFPTSLSSLVSLFSDLMKESKS